MALRWAATLASSSLTFWVSCGRGAAITLLQLLDPIRQLLGDPFNLGFQRAALTRLPFIFHQQGFDLVILQLGVVGKHRFIEGVAGLLMGFLGPGLGVEQLLHLLEHSQLLLVGGDLDTPLDAGGGHLLLVVHRLNQTALFPALLLDKALQCQARFIQRGLQGIELFCSLAKKRATSKAGGSSSALYLALPITRSGLSLIFSPCRQSARAVPDPQASHPVRAHRDRLAAGFASSPSAADRWRMGRAAHRSPRRSRGSAQAVLHSPRRSAPWASRPGKLAELALAKPLGERRQRRLFEAGKLLTGQYGAFDLGGGDPRLTVTGTQRGKQGGLESQEYPPVGPSAAISRSGMPLAGDRPDRAGLPLRCHRYSAGY